MDPLRFSPRSTPSRWSLAAGVLALLAAAPAARAAEPVVRPDAVVEQRYVLLQGAAKNEPPHSGPHHHSKQPGEDKDLTTLSLEELMDLEIVPINVLGGHTHPAGQWMVGYRLMYSNLGGLLNGTQDLSTRRLLRRYVDVPTTMDMEMHMLEGMYAPNEKLTLMLMLPYTRMTMERTSLIPGGHGHGRRPSRGRITPQSHGGPHDRGSFETRSAGWGDLTVMSLYTVWGSTESGRRLLFNGGLSMPTGSIEKEHGNGDRHEYMMQLGSGTVDLMPGLTFLGESEHWSWGAQAIGTVRLGRNDVGYRFGNRLRLNAWGSYRLTEWAAPSVRLEAQRWGNIRGQDPQLDPLFDPTFNPNNYGGERIDLLAGLNLYAPRGKWKGARLSIEGGVPVYQSLDGPQLETDWMLGFSLSYTR